MKFKLIDEWKSALTMYSMWFFAAVGIAPDLYNLAIQYGLLTGDAAPAKLAYIINVIAFTGAASRLIKQQKLELEVEKIKKAQEEAAGLKEDVVK